MNELVLWFLLALLLPCWALLTFSEYRHGHASIGVYMKADRSTKPVLFWFYLIFNVIFILLGVAALVGWAREMYS